MELFSENLGSIKSDEELTSLKQQFPEYDLAYICQATLFDRKKVREWMERLWKQYEPYADKQFLKDFKRQFTQRAWELYLGTTFMNRGFHLGKHRAVGPDLDIRDEASGKRLVWIEAIAVEKGEGNDRVPDVVYGGVSSVPEEQMMLRLAGALEKKFKRYCSELEKGVVKDDEPYVIAIDRSALQHVDASAPLILKTLFGIGDLTITFELGDNGHKPKDVFWSELPKLDKISGKPVPMRFFLDATHAGISAVIYSHHDIINSPRVPKEMGENFLIAHNPYAKNPLLHNFFPFGDEFVVKENSVQRIRKKKDYNHPDAFDYLES